MRQVAVFNEKIEAMALGRLQLNSNVQQFELNENPITCGLITCNDTTFDVNDPRNAHRVMVRKKAFSCNYRDKAFAVQAQRRIDGFAAFSQVKFDTLGSEFVGEVVAIGREVDQLAVGDLVVSNGSYPFTGYYEANPGLPTNQGSKRLDIFHFSKLLRVPDHFPIVEAAGIPLGGQTVFSMIRRLNLQPNDTVLVTAATSNTSLLAISALRHCGIPLTICTLTTRAEFSPKLKALGADEVFVVRKGEFPLREQEQIKAFVKENQLFNAVIDPFFDLYLSQTIDLIAMYGKYISCGMYDQSYIGRKEVVEEWAPDYNSSIQKAILKNVQLIGNCLGSTQDLQNAIDAYTEGRLEVVIDTVFGAGQEAAFFERSFNHANRFGKVIYRYEN